MLDNIFKISCCLLFSKCSRIVRTLNFCKIIVPASYPDVSLDVRAKEGGKETTGVCTLPMVPCGSSPVTRFALASAMRKTKRLRRRLSLCIVKLLDLPKGEFTELGCQGDFFLRGGTGYNKNPTHYKTHQYTG